MTDYFITMARYHGWATRRLLDAIAHLSDEDYDRNSGLFFGSIHRTLNHQIVTERLWFARFFEGSSPVVALDAEVSTDRHTVALLLRAAIEPWKDYIASLPPDRFAGRLDYRTMRGSDVSLPFAPTLAHVFNHGTHHRGQMTAALTGLGKGMPELDLVYMLQGEQNT